MEKCLGCEKEFEEEEMIDTISYLGDGIYTDFAGLFCKGCVGDKEICSYCGVPTDEIVYEEGDEFDFMQYCQECFDEVKDYLEAEREYYDRRF